MYIIQSPLPAHLLSAGLHEDIERYMCRKSNPVEVTIDQLLPTANPKIHPILAYILKFKYIALYKKALSSLNLILGRVSPVRNRTIQESLPSLSRGLGK